MLSASGTIAEISAPMKGLPVYLAGSLVVEEEYGKSNAHTDCDLFVPSGNVLIAAVERLLGDGFTLDSRNGRAYERWLRIGFKKWHTNSIKLMRFSNTSLDPDETIEVNVVYKLTEGHPTTSLAQVLESFDFGLLGVGYDLEDGIKRDLRPYLFPGLDINGPLPMMPNKQTNWERGLISQYNGLREAGRYAKYTTYGYDLSLVKDVLIKGYWIAAAYHADRDDPDKVQLGKIYEALALHIEHDNIDQLFEAGKQVQYLTALDQIMEALE